MVDQGLQRRLGFSDHAIERFGERAGLPARDRMRLEPVLRDLLTQEGRLVSRRPGWARSDNPADAYVQVGEWLLLVCRHDVRRPGSWTVVTVINRGGRMTWERAIARGLVGTPPPLASGPPKRSRVGVVAAIRTAAGGGGSRLRLPGRIVAELRARRTEAGREFGRRRGVRGAAGRPGGAAAGGAGSSPAAVRRLTRETTVGQSGVSRRHTRSASRGCVARTTRAS